MNTTKQSCQFNALTVVLPNTLTCSAYEDRVLGLFWSSYLPNGQALSSETVQDTLAGWTNAVRELYPTDDILKKTVLAMCLTSNGRHEGQKWMVEED